MALTGRIVAIVGRLGVYPMVRLSLPARRILAYLALRLEPVPRPFASADLWPDSPEEVGRANLRRALWNTPTGWITSRGDELILNASSDLARAEAVAARALGGEELSLDEIKLLSSDILPGWHEEWVVPAQERFRLLRIQALEAACRTMIGSGQLALAIQAGAAALAAEPLRESAAEALIEAHLAQSNRFEAMRCYRSLEQRLKVELGVAPQASLASLMASCQTASPMLH
ncbi:DNA-binding SARP family transcriptional activator [Rhizobium mesoamericanum]|uniref:AfsR/SARP family transcriptional regulator n=1 Tax=Rhizobium mesoamericanum TaxID=1079800 RepID=UPI00278B0349|nr:BTAD domain-containing putative transcriptional regulator [Rhizobium mesoamericanum]MDQ0564387.1 DNA-binding SARP family transcriptional activator [Rhizobium mesoamericanum]